MTIRPNSSVVPGGPTSVEILRGPLVDAASKLGVPLTETQIELLLRFIALLGRWNATYNLTSVRAPAAMLSQHVVDCLAVIQPLQRWASNAASARRLLDVGSGGGLPGVVVAVVCPELEVVCVDAVGKKVAFVRQVAAELALRNLAAEHGRVEALNNGRFDVVTSRAFASLSDFVAATRQQLTDGGVWMAMKGRSPQAEITALPPDIVVFHVEQLQVPGLDVERCLVWMVPKRGEPPCSE